MRPIVRALAPHVLGAHVDDALEAELRTHRRRRDSVLARAGLRDDPALAEPAGEHGLPERIVQLVCAGAARSAEIEPLARNG